MKTTRSTLPFRYITVKQAAERMKVSQQWILEHIDEFPNTVRLPDAGHHPDDLRLKESDIEKRLAERN